MTTANNRKNTIDSIRTLYADHLNGAERDALLWGLQTAFKSRVLDGMTQPIPTSATLSTQSESSRRLTDDQRAQLHEKIVRNIWEPELYVELVDRIVELVDCNVVSLNELSGAVLLAKSKKALWEASNGEKGREMWSFLGTWCKKNWERSGRTWTKCSGATERKPEEIKSESIASKVERRLAESDGRNAGEDRELSLEELRSCLHTTMNAIRRTPRNATQAQL